METVLPPEDLGALLPGSAVLPRGAVRVLEWCWVLKNLEALNQNNNFGNGGALFLEAK